MSRWFRFYDDTINDPKVLKLPEAMRWHWTAILCIASKYDGRLPAMADVALLLRMTPQKAAATVACLVGAGLIDKDDEGFRPHNWDGRQYKSDVSNERVKRHRQRKRNADCNVTVTPPETEAETDTDISEANASGAVAPNDPRTRLFNEGLTTLAKISGRGPNACRSFVGKCLKAVNDDAVTVLGLIEEAERNRIAEPTAWIVASLKSPQFPQGNRNGKRTVQDAARDLVDRFRAFDEPQPTGDLRGPAGGAPLRLLSQG